MPPLCAGGAHTGGCRRWQLVEHTLTAAAYGSWACTCLLYQTAGWAASTGMHPAGTRPHRASPPPWSAAAAEDSSRARLFHVLASTAPGGPLDAYQILLRLLHRNDWFTQVGAGTS